MVKIENGLDWQKAYELDLAISELQERKENNQLTEKEKKLFAEIDNFNENFEI